MEKNFTNDFDVACTRLGRSNKLPDVSTFPESYQQEVLDRYVLETIAEANGGGVGVVTADTNKRKHYPYFWIEKDPKKSSGFGLSFLDLGCGYGNTAAALGSRLVFLDPDAAIYMGKNVTPFYEKLLK